MQIGDITAGKGYISNVCHPQLVCRSGNQPLGQVLPFVEAVVGIGRMAGFRVASVGLQRSCRGLACSRVRTGRSATACSRLCGDTRSGSPSRCLRSCSTSFSMSTGRRPDGNGRHTSATLLLRPLTSSVATWPQVFFGCQTRPCLSSCHGPGSPTWRIPTPSPVPGYSATSSL